MTKVNILHLSDLHFGIEPSQERFKTALAQRTNTLDELINVLKKTVNTEWKPDIVAISGDIGWSGCYEDYLKARTWIKGELLKVFGLDVDNLIVCAGNHDINRDETMGMEPPLTHEKADKWLSIENLKKFIEPFKDYNRFCEEFKIPELSISENKYHLIGQREIKGLRFVVLNSAWFCRGDEDRGNLWMGLPQLKVMNAALQLTDPEQYDTGLITISILHHPPGWLNDYETNSYAGRINTFRYLSERSHIILCGHVHGAIEEPDRIHNSAFFFKGGATYSGDNYRNNFSIYQIDKESRKFKRCDFEFNPSKGNWGQEESEQQLLRKLVPEKSELSSFSCDNLDPEIRSYCEKITNEEYFDENAVTSYREMQRDDIRKKHQSETNQSFLVSKGYLSKNRLTLAGALMFGSEHSRTSRMAIVKCSWYDAFDNAKGTAKKKEDLSDPIHYQIVKTLDFIKSIIGSYEKKLPNNAQQQIIYEYPMECLEEIVANAICHRDYKLMQQPVQVIVFSDRIKIGSPGIWIGEQLEDTKEYSLKELECEAKQRNATLAQAIFAIRLSEGRGEGIPHSIRDCKDREAKIPTVKQVKGSVFVTIFPCGDYKNAEKVTASLFAEEISSYCKTAESLYAQLPVAGFVTQLKVPIDIADIYVPLRAMLNLSGDEAIFADATHAEKIMAERDSAVEIHLPEAFKEAQVRKCKGLVILGDPGSGKTTHLKRLLLVCLREGPEMLNLPSGILPVFLPLRELRDLSFGLDLFIQQQLASPHLETPEGFGKRLLNRGNLLFLLDGLDEVTDLKQRERVAGWILEAISAHPTCYFVVTCRFAGYSSTVHMSANFLEMHVRPFKSDDVSRFVQNWYKIVEQGLAKDPEQAGVLAREKADNLIKRLNDADFRTSKVVELTRNPLLLTNICLIHRHRDDLPNKRYKLYEECIDVLLEYWRKPKKLQVGVTARDGRRVLQPVALWMHGKDGRTRAKASELIPHIEPVLKAVGWSRGTARDFLRTIRDESGLLTGWDQEHYGFMHLGFQEYLVAREIRSRAFKDKDVLRDLAAHFGESWWQEVTLIMLALEDPSLFEEFMEEVVKLPAFAANPGLVDMCLEDAAETSVQLFMDIINEEPGKDEELWQRQAAALRVVKRLDESVLDAVRDRLEKHPSVEISQRFKEYSQEESAERNVVTAKQGGYELIRIPGGSFMMGSPESEKGRYDDEGPQHEVSVPEFYMGVTPVTNRQYGIFMAENTEVIEPEYWADRRFNQPEQPVVGVSWDDAKKYAEWAGLRLPTEAEWEYACRAGTTTSYYLGDGEKNIERAGWYKSNSSKLSHPVGEKELNGFGLYDMHGNVWEWVEDDWHENYHGAPDNGNAWVGNRIGSSRVIRGGGWVNDDMECRSASRSYAWPNIGYDNRVGFRLSSSVALDS